MNEEKPEVKHKSNNKMIALIAGGVAVVVAIVVLIVVLTRNKNPLVGTWCYDSWCYTFNEDKTGKYEVAGYGTGLTYEYDNEKIEVTFEGSDTSSSLPYTIKDNDLIVKDYFDNEVVYTKK